MRPEYLSESLQLVPLFSGKCVLIRRSAINLYSLPTPLPDEFADTQKIPISQCMQKELEKLGSERQKARFLL
jgi:hypothetical protein